MAKRILIKPLITEKTDRLSSEFNQYTFVVNKNANKVEIKQAIEDKYAVSVEEVSTMIMPGKSKSRAAKRAYINGRTSSFKKAIVKVAEGEEINIYGEV